jgi:tetratricopeptide (TPR) repeat protein
MKYRAVRTVTIVAAIFMIVKITNLFLADISFSQGYGANLAGEYKESVEKIESAIKLNKHEPMYYRELADSYCSLALIKTFLRAEQKENALYLSERLISLSPTDLEAPYLLQLSQE